MSKKILIVDDNSDLLDVLQQGLKQYDLILAENGKQAVELAYTLHPDLILMDLMMPEMDGPQAIDLIRQNPKTHSIPILAISAGLITNIKEECSKIGCDDFIAKPFTFTQLGFRIEKLLKSNEKNKRRDRSFLPVEVSRICGMIRQVNKAPVRWWSNFFG